MRGHSLLSLMLWIFESGEKQSLGDRIWNILTAAGTVIGAGGIASTVVIFYWKRITSFFGELKQSREKEPHLYNLVPWNIIPSFAPKERKAIILLETINRGALATLDKDDNEAPTPRQKVSFVRRIVEGINRSLSPALRPEKAKLVWPRASLDHLKNAQRFFVPPATTFVEPGKPPVRTEGISALVKWIGEAEESSSADDDAGRFWVFASNSAGKTIFMHRLFLELTGRGSPDFEAVPMFAAAETVRAHHKQIDKLKEASDAVADFAIAWLANRHIRIPENKKAAYGTAFKEALSNGQIILLLDGVDELVHQGLADFTKNLLGPVKYWVASNSPTSGQLVSAHRALTLRDVWTLEQMALSIDQRMPDGSSMQSIRETVKQTVSEVLKRHDQAFAKGTTDQNHHWLSQPGNFHLFLKNLTPDLTAREIRKLAESQPLLFQQIFERAVAHINAQQDQQLIAERLFEIAANDPSVHRDGTGPASLAHDRITDQVKALTGIIVSAKSLSFKNAAMREYFLAGRIAREIRDPAVRIDDTDELARTDRWDSAKQEAVMSWLAPLSPAEIAPMIRSKLRRRRGATQLNGAMRRNLLDLLLKLDRDTPLDDLDFSEMVGDRIDLSRLQVQSCSFVKAELQNAELGGATFTNCDFTSADLSAADALGTRFTNCVFDSANLHEMAIGRAVGDDDESAERKQLEDKGATDFRTRYRDEFGEAWPAFQKAALGPGFEELEEKEYLPRIRKSVASRDSAEPVYLVDLMAGGSYERVTDLLDEFSNLHILGVDRDLNKHKRPDRLAWTKVELGGGKSNGKDRLGLDLRASLTNEFGQSAYPAHAIIGKKALHEIDRSLQPALLERCAQALSPGGQVILFVDAPGPANSDNLVVAELAKIHRELSTLRDCLRGDPSPREVRAAIENLSYDGSPTSQIGFTNTWIMLKDWVNQNRHEVANRYFASVAEIKQWASPCLGEPVSATNAKYRLNPLMFNELGILSVLHHVKVHGAESVVNDRRRLQEMIGESDRLNVLVEFSRKHLADTPLGANLEAAESPISLVSLNRDLEPLDTGTKAWSFALNCSVLVFEKGAGPEVSAAP